MTSTLLAPTQKPGRAGLRHAVRAEWTKFWSVRSTSWSLVSLVAITIGLSLLSTHALRSQGGLAPDPLRRILIGFNLGQFAIGVLGVLFVSAEYSTGQIRSTLAVMPRRSTVVVAKAIVMGAVSLVVGEVLSFSTFFVGNSMLTGSRAYVVFSSPGVLRVLLESGVYLALLGLFGLGLGFILRSTAGAIATFASLVLVLTLIINAMPSFIVNAVSRYLPANIGATVFSVSTPGRFQGVPTFTPLVGLVVLGVYALVALGVGSVLLTRRDS